MEEQDRQVVVVHVYLAATTGGVLSSSRLPQPNDPCAVRDQARESLNDPRAVKDLALIASGHWLQ